MSDTYEIVKVKNGYMIFEGPSRMGEVRFLSPWVFETLENALGFLRERLCEKGKKMKPKNPVGKCFDSAAMQACFGKHAPDDMRLVHAVCFSQKENREIGHAWVEFDKDGVRMAFDTTFGALFDAAKYREGLKVSYSVEYTRQQAFKHWYKKDSAGPWDEKILEVVNKNG